MTLGRYERWLTVVIIVLGAALVLYWLVVLLADGREGTTMFTSPILGRCTPPTWFTAKGCELIRYTPERVLRTEIVKYGIVIVLLFASFGLRSRVAIVLTCVIGLVLLAVRPEGGPLLLLALLTIWSAWSALRNETVGLEK